jgi:hypothetical protein
MSASQAPRGDHPGPDRYEVRVKGHLAGRWAAWFDGLTLTPQSDGTTLIEGPVVDQAALHGLLQKVRDTGMPLVSVEHVEPAPPASSTTTPDNSSTLQGD